MAQGHTFMVIARGASGFVAPAIAADRPDALVSLTLTQLEVQEVSGGYKRPSDQLRELHRRGFVRAYRSGPSGRLIVERGHYEAITRNGLDRSIPAVLTPSPATTLRQPDRAGFMAVYARKRKA